MTESRGGPPSAQPLHLFQDMGGPLSHLPAETWCPRSVQHAQRICRCLPVAGLSPARRIVSTLLHIAPPPPPPRAPPAAVPVKAVPELLTL